MAHRITGIDHVLLAVRDLDAATHTFARLGFTASPRGVHEEWGTANRCLMLAKGYVELIAPIGDGPGARRVAAHLDSWGEGLMGVALGSSDAQQSYQSLLRAGVKAGAPSPLSRRIEVADGELRPSFAVVDLAAETTPGLPVFLCQHLTPELLRRPAWLDHANGASSLMSVTVVIDHPEAAMPEYNRLFGPAASTPTDEMVTVHSGRGLIYLVTADGFDLLHPELDLVLSDPPALVAMSIGVADLDRTAGWLDSNGIEVSRKGGHLGIDAAEVFGIGLEFVQA